MINKSLVSICIPTYNGSEFIAEAMESAIVQTYPKLEIVVSDDASKDETLQLIESYKHKTKHPIYIHNHEPSGIGANWNNCLRHARGRYIKFLFQDDILLPTCIQEMVEILENDNSVALVASKREFIVEPSFLNEDSEKWIEVYGDLQRMLNLPIDNNISYIDASLFRSIEFFRSPLNKIGEPSVVLFKKEIIQEFGFFRENLKQVLDYEFFYRLLKKYRIAVVNKELVQFRLHDKQTTFINKDNNSYGVDHAIFERIIYDEYFRYLSPGKKKELLRKYNRFVSFFYGMIDFVKIKWRAIFNSGL